MKKALFWSLFIVLLLVKPVYAQDHVYSQFFNAPNYLNPALNGQFNGDLRFNMIYRSQWTNLPDPLNYYTFAVDYQVPRFGGGFGLMATQSSEGIAYFKKTNISGIYSYSVIFDSGALSFGLQAGLTNRSIDFEKLVFSDQIDPETGIIPGSTSSASSLPYNRRSFFDAGAGINLVKGDLMIGFAVQHLNKPDQSFTGTKATLAPRYNGHLSYKILTNTYIDDAPAIIPSVVYFQQGTVKSYSGGLQFKTRNVNLGVWYRGDGDQHDAVVFSLILDLFPRRDTYDKLRIGMSHDATLSKISWGKTAGTTEGALNYEITFPRSYRPSNENSGKRCYDFY